MVFHKISSWRNEMHFFSNIRGRKEGGLWAQLNGPGFEGRRDLVEGRQPQKSASGTGGPGPPCVSRVKTHAVELVWTRCHWPPHGVMVSACTAAGGWRGERRPMGANVCLAPSKELKKVQTIKNNFQWNSLQICILQGSGDFAACTETP